MDVAETQPGGPWSADGSRASSSLLPSAAPGKSTTNISCLHIMILLFRIVLFRVLSALSVQASMAYITMLTRRKLEAAYASALRERNQRAQLLLASDPGNVA